MTAAGILGIVVAALVAIVSLLGKLWHSAATERDVAKAERDAQIGARTDDASRFEDVIAAKNKAAAAELAKVPTDIAGVRQEIKELGGVPLPDELTKPGGKP